MTAATPTGSSSRAQPARTGNPDVWQAGASSVRGASHERTGAPNQDCGRAALLDGGGTAVIAVADGHGDSMHARSDRGSRFAVEVAIGALTDWMKTNGGAASVQSSGTELVARIVSDWRAAVAGDVERHPVAADQKNTLPHIAPFPEILYGTTLIATAINDRLAIYVQIGDGDLLTVAADGTASRPVPGRDDLPSNITESLCQTDAGGRFRTRVELFADRPPPALLLLSTDGYSNSFVDDAAFLKVGADIKAMLEDHGLAWVADRLEGWLTETSATGSGDDVTLALAWHGATPVRELSRVADPGKAPWRLSHLLAPFLILLCLLLGGTAWTMAPPSLKATAITHVVSIRDKIAGLVRVYGEKAFRALGLVAPPPPHPERIDDTDRIKSNGPAPSLPGGERD